MVKLLLCVLILFALPATVSGQGLLGVFSPPVETADIQETQEIEETDSQSSILPVDWYKPLGEQDYWQTYFEEWRLWTQKVKDGQERLKPHQSTLASIRAKDRFNYALEQRDDLTESQKARYRKRYSIKEMIVNRLVKKGRQEIIDEAKGLAVKPLADGVGQVKRNVGEIISHSTMSGEEE